MTSSLAACVCVFWPLSLRVTSVVCSRVRWPTNILCVCVCMRACGWVCVSVFECVCVWVYQPVNEGSSRINRSRASSIISINSLQSPSYLKFTPRWLCVCVCAQGLQSVCEAQQWSWTGPCSIVHQWKLWSPVPVWREGYGPPQQKTLEESHRKHVRTLYICSHKKMNGQ